MVRLTSDVAALKTLTQMSLRIGTRRASADGGQPDPDGQYQPQPGVDHAPVAAGHLGHSRILHPQDGAALPDRPAKTGPIDTVLQENVAGVRLVKAFVRANFEASASRIRTRIIPTSRSG